MKFPEAIDWASKVSCGCNVDEHLFAYNAIMEAPDRPKAAIVEVGSWMQGLTLTLAAAAQERGWYVYALDTWHLGSLPGSPNDVYRHPLEDGIPEEVEKLMRYDDDLFSGRLLDILYRAHRYWIFQEGLENLIASGLRPCVRHVIGDSLDTTWELSFTDGIAFLWIDSAHDAVHALEEGAHLAPEVTGGGVIGFHDAQEAGVINCIERLQPILTEPRWTELDLPPAQDHQGPALESGVDCKAPWRTRAWKRNP